MRLDGIHHVTAITADAQRNVDFYAGVLGLRLVKTTVNFDAPDMYHLYFGDRVGAPGSILTFFEIRGAGEGAAGPGMIHRVVLRVPSEDALDEWAVRLERAGRPVDRLDGAVVTADPEGLGLELRVSGTGEPPLVAPGVPAGIAITGVEGVRMSSVRPDLTRIVTRDVLGFREEGEDGPLVAEGARRSGTVWIEPAPNARGIPGAGTVHHVAWASEDADHEAWRDRVREVGLHGTDVIDRQYFHSVYFREPGGVLYEIATLSPGFAVDEPEATLGEDLKLPPQYEPHRAEIVRRLTPFERPAAEVG